MSPDTYLQFTKKVQKFKWTEEAKKASKDIEELLTSPPVLIALTLNTLL